MGGARSDLVRHEQRGQARVVGGDQETVDQPGPGRGVGEGGDDHQLVRVGHDDPFHRVGVVGGAAQHGRARLDPDHPGEGARLAGDVPGQRDPVAHHHAAAAEFAGPHRGHRAVPDESPVTAAVHRRHEGLGRVLVRGPAPGPWPGALRGPDPDVILVQVGVGRLPVQGARSSIAAHARGEAGERLAHGGHVLDLQAGHREAEHRRGHHQPVIVVGGEGAAGPQRPRPDLQPVSALGHVAAQRVDLGGQGGEPVGLLVPLVADPGQHRRGAGQGGERAEHHRDLAAVGQVGGDPAQRGRAGDGQPVRAYRARPRPCPAARAGCARRAGWSPRASPGWSRSPR